jgi:hypothetical protein
MEHVTDTAAKTAPCWLCDGAGFVVVAVCGAAQAYGREARAYRGHKCSESCVKAEPCLACRWRESKA